MCCSAENVNGSSVQRTITITEESEKNRKPVTCKKFPNQTVDILV